MTLADWGAVGGIIAGIIALGGLIYGVTSFISKIGRMDKSLQALVVIHTSELIEYYKKTSSSLFNPVSPSERDILLDKLERGTLTAEELYRLKQILKEQEAEAKRRGEQMTVMAIAALLLLIALLSKK